MRRHTIGNLLPAVAALSWIAAAAALDCSAFGQSGSCAPSSSCTTYTLASSVCSAAGSVRSTTACSVDLTNLLEHGLLHGNCLLSVYYARRPGCKRGMFGEGRFEMQ